MEEHTQTLSRVKRAQDREKVLRYSIRKYGFGAASVAVAALYLFMGRGAVYAAETSTGATAPETTEMVPTPESEGEVPAEVAAAIQSGKEKIKKTTQEKIAALKADKTLSPEKLKELTTSVELSSAVATEALDTLGSSLDVKGIEGLVDRALDAIQNAEKAADTTETEEMEENKPTGDMKPEETSASDSSETGNAKEESDEEVAKTLAGLKMKITEQKDAAISSVNSDSEASDEDKKADIAFVNDWADKTIKELDEAYHVGADSEELTAKANELTEELIKYFEESEEEGETTDEPTGDMKPEETPAPVDRTAALKAIEDAKSEQEGKINAREGLSDDEQADALEEIGDEAEKATKAVNEAKTQEDVTAAQNEGVKQIKTVNPVGKEYALEEIDTDLEDKKAEITKDTKLSEEQKKTIVADLEQGAKELKEAIAKLPEYEETDEAAVETEKQIEELVNGFKESLKQAVPEDTKEETPAAVDRTAALKAIEDAKKAREETIDADDNLSDKEVSAAKSKIATAVEGAKKAINAATSQETVDAEKEKGLVAVKSVNPVGKDIPIDDLRDAVATKKAEIAKNDKLTSEEKEAANKKIDAGLEKLVKGITAGLPSYVDTPDDVEEMNQTILGLVNQFKKGLDKVGIPADKPKADTPKPKEDAPAPKEEKPAAPTEDKLVKAKEAAKKEIAEELALVSANFESDESLSDNEKSEAKAGAKDVADQATQKVDEATTEEAVNEAKELGLTSLDNIYPIAIEKSEAEITKAADAKKAEITANKNLSKAEQKAAIAQVDAAVKKATEAFSKVPTDIEDEESADKAQEGVDNAKTTALKEIEAVKPIALDSLKAAVKKAQKDKLKEIQAATYLTAEERQKLESDVNTVATTTLKGFDGLAKKGVTEAALAEIKNQAVDTIQSIEVPAAPKEEKPAMVEREAALRAIDDAKTAQEKAIDARSEELSDTEIQAAKEEVEKSVAVAKKAINEAKTQEDVDKASKAGVADIATINPVPTDRVYESMEATVKEVTAQIDAVKGASKESKDVAKAKLTDLLKAQYDELYDEDRPAYVDTVEKLAKETEKAVKRLTDFADKVLAVLAEVKSAEADSSKPEEKPKSDEPVAPSKPEEKPKSDEPVAPSKPEDKPKADEPVVPSKPEDKPKSDEPAAPSKPEDKPKADEPVAPSKPEDKPKADEPVVPSKPEDKPKADEPVAPSKPADKPSSETPSEPMKPMDKEQPATPKKRTLDDAATHTHVAGTEASLAGVDHLVVQKVKSAVLEGRDYDAFDIELRDANDKAIQPHGSVRVSLPARKAVEAVYYIDADNKLAVKEFTQADGMVSFDTDHFSVYALVYKAEKDAPSPMATNQDKSEKMEAKKDDKKELPNTGDETPTVSFLVGLALALMGMLALKHKEN